MKKNQKTEPNQDRAGNHSNQPTKRDSKREPDSNNPRANKDRHAEESPGKHINNQFDLDASKPRNATVTYRMI